MAWFDRNDAKVPEKLRNAKPEDLEAALDFYTTNKDKLAQMEQQIETDKKTALNVQNELASTKERLANIEAKAGQPVVEKKEATPAPKDWLEDPNGAFLENVKPLADFALSQGAMVAQMRFENHITSLGGDNYKIYKKYLPEILNLMKNEPPANHANPQTWFNAFTLIKGAHMEEIVEARQKQDGAFFGEPAKSASGPDEKKDDQITDDDRQQAKNYGISPEEVLKARKGATYAPVIN